MRHCGCAFAQQLCLHFAGWTRKIVSLYTFNEQDRWSSGTAAQIEFKNTAFAEGKSARASSTSTAAFAGSFKKAHDCRLINSDPKICWVIKFYKLKRDEVNRCERTSALSFDLRDRVERSEMYNQCKSVAAIKCHWCRRVAERCGLQDKMVQEMTEQFWERANACDSPFRMTVT